MDSQLKEVFEEELREKDKEIELLKLDIEHKKRIKEKEKEIANLSRQSEGLLTIDQELDQIKIAKRNHRFTRMMLLVNIIGFLTIATLIWGIKKHNWFRVVIEKPVSVEIEKIKVVEKPIEVEKVKIVNVPVPVEKEVPVERVVYRDRIVEKPIEVEKIIYKDKIVEKIKEVPVEKIIYRDEKTIYKGKGRCFEIGMTVSQLIQLVGEPQRTEKQDKHILFVYQNPKPYLVGVDSRTKKVVDWTDGTPEEHKCNF